MLQKTVISVEALKMLYSERRVTCLDDNVDYQDMNEVSTYFNFNFKQENKFNIFVQYPSNVITLLTCAVFPALSTGNQT
jgi:hypothetical protein